MSRFEIKMPKLGESITEGTIVSWSVKVGDVIQEDDILFEVNTAKVSAEIPSPVAGKVVEILYKEGDTVAVGTVVAVVDLDGEESSGETTVNEDAAKVETNSVSDTISTETTNRQQELKAVVVAEERWYSPVVIQLAKEASIPKEELDSIQGTGYEGRLSKKDIKDYIDKKKRGVSETSKPGTSVPATSSVSSVKSASSASTVAVSTASTAITSVASPKQTLAPETNISGVELKEMDRVRRIIADHMVMSKKVSPHVTNVVEVDVTKLVRWRDQNKDAFFRREGVKLTYMPAITEAVAKALAAYPQVNVSVDGYNILFKKHINIGIAVSLNDGNLIVPVVHDADHLNLNGLAVTIDSLAIKARDNKLMPEDIDGGTFTITNFGTFKSLFGTPIINQPQVAILGVGYIEKKPAVVETPEGDTIAIRHKMYLSLSYDHRVVDGMLGGNFLHFIADYLENWKG
ncbi:dihydrolipoamide acetyltransferase family protein [Bacteroides sp.]|uniref:dihydrolipoamide acetyltransferase family protein n=1 Tax=Bacteroides sp. TaxID=29523 RepID=UPI0026230AF7|nr:dihydrolipoamide acetyltransferase family protein [Bacteroides sp.]MDD3037556.1 dihydrolipoamide acetyltransferase family protein [Bacteroides sp.]